MTTEQRMIPVPMSRERLLEVLDDIRERVAEGDSFEGNLGYLLPDPDDPPGTFRVQASYRVGNTAGQGGLRMIGDWHDVPVPGRISRDLIQEIAGLCTSKGWRSEASGAREGHEFAAYVALGHSEFSEALEAYRDKCWSATCSPTVTGEHHPHCSGKPHGPGKPVGVGPELADVIIRVLDISDIWKLDINREVERVLAYGWTRSYRHGGRQL